MRFIESATPIQALLAGLGGLIGLGLLFFFGYLRFGHGGTKRLIVRDFNLKNPESTAFRLQLLGTLLLAAGVAILFGPSILFGIQTGDVEGAKESALKGLLVLLFCGAVVLTLMTPAPEIQRPSDE